MTIVVTKQGNVETFAGKCGLCKTEITYHVNDIKVYRDPVTYMGSRYVDCPTCKGEISHVEGQRVFDSTTWGKASGGSSKCSYCGNDPMSAACQSHP